MDFRLVSLKWPLLLAVAVLAAVSSLGSQPEDTNAWQPIVFSSPSNTVISSNLTPQAAQPSSPDFPSTLHLLQDTAPVTTFDYLPAGPAPAPVVRQRLRKLPSGNRDWEFMTPAEILGVAPHQILQNQNRDANSSQNSLTPLERYIEKQSLSARIKANLSDNPSPPQYFGVDGNGATNDVLFDLFSGNLGSLHLGASNPEANNALNNTLFAAPSGTSGWSKLFSLSLPQAAPDSIEQQQQQQQQQQQRADMERFMQLLNPNSTPVATADASVGVASPSQPQTALPFSIDSTQPLANPIGTSFAPLRSDIVGNPTGLAPLPGITRQPSPQPVTPPTWAPQPPPWMSSVPQPFAIPQRKF